MAFLIETHELLRLKENTPKSLKVVDEIRWDEFYTADGTTTMNETEALAVRCGEACGPEHVHGALNEAGEVLSEQKLATTPKAMKEVFGGHAARLDCLGIRDALSSCRW